MNKQKRNSPSNHPPSHKRKGKIKENDKKIPTIKGRKHKSKYGKCSGEGGKCKSEYGKHTSEGGKYESEYGKCVRECKKSKSKYGK